MSVACQHRQAAPQLSSPNVAPNCIVFTNQTSGQRSNATNNKLTRFNYLKKGKNRFLYSYICMNIFVPGIKTNVSVLCDKQMHLFTYKWLSHYLISA